MEQGLNTNLILITSFVFAFMLNAFFKWFLKEPSSMAAPKLPQSPPSLPFIGHLHLIGKVLPVSFQCLARRYGPLMEIRLGASKCVVVSSSSVAREIFKDQELNFSSRPEFGSAEYFKYKGSRFVLAQYGDYWRFMKKLCMTKLLAVPQLEKFADIREYEKLKLVESVAMCCREGLPCDLSSQFVSYTNNVICRMAMSTRCSGTYNEAEEIRELVKTCLELAGKISVGDVLGPLKILDFSGNGKKLVAVMEKYDRDPKAEIKLTRNDMKSFLLVCLLPPPSCPKGNSETPPLSTSDHKRMRRRLPGERVPCQVKNTCACKCLCNHAGFRTVEGCRQIHPREISREI